MLFQTTRKAICRRNKAGDSVTASASRRTKFSSTLFSLCTSSHWPGFASIQVGGGSLEADSRDHSKCYHNVGVSPIPQATEASMLIFYSSRSDCDLRGRPPIYQ